MKSTRALIADQATRYVPRSVAAIRREYEATAKARQGYQRAKWGSHAGMHNAFALGAKIIPWQRVRDWLDIGCGEADFFKKADAKGYRFTRMHGWDVTPSMLKHARAKQLHSPATFATKALQSLARGKQPQFDLVTLVGVLQQCGMPPQRAAQALARATRKKKYVFLTTKNAAWQGFVSGELTPEPSHSWFTPAEIRNAFRAAGFRILRLEGFIPATNRIVSIEASHTMFLLAQRLA
jgi:2-polyprenyl-3-methyl-5-hydroxy-6-metoxy-1,4-benzoquinol methylase